MTTLRRELRQNIKNVLKSHLDPEACPSLLEELVAVFDKFRAPKAKGLDWLIAAGVNSEEIIRLADNEQRESELLDHYEREMGYNPLTWSGSLERLRRFLLTKTPEEISTFAAWSKREYSPLSPTQARRNPDLVIDCWPQAFAAEKADTDPRYQPYTAEDNLNLITPERAAELLAKAKRKAKDENIFSEG